MWLLRLLLPIVALLLAGLGVAWLITREARYLRLAWRLLQAIGVLLLAFGLFYLFSRVLLVV